MLIQALCQYYDMNTEEVSDGVPKYFENVEISHKIFLTPEGKISSIQDIREKVGIDGKKKPVVRKKTFILPIRSQKPGIDLNIAEHRPLYIFGLNYDKKSDSFTPEDNTNKAKKSHECFVNGNLEFCEGLDSPIINAFREFLINWNPADETENPHLKAISKDYSTASYCFALEGRPDILLNNDALLKKKYTEYAELKESDSQSGKTLSMCPIEGKMLPVSKIHNKIKKGIRGGNAMGMTLVGYNAESFESYRKEQSYNSNISENAMEKYTAAMNYLLTNSMHHLYLDDMTLFYFGLSTDEEEECDCFSQFLNCSDDDDEVTELQKDLHAAAKAFQNGTVPDISVFTKNTDFVIAGVTPNAARISVKFLLRGSFGNIMKNLFQHQNDLNTEKNENLIPMWRIFKELVSPKETKGSIPPPLQSAIMLAALNGTRYPDAMLHTVLRRIKTDDSMGAKFGAIKIGLIKAYLNRKARLSNNKEEITLALNTENKNPAYLCGRLFAVLERIQQKASSDKLNRTIKDSFFASACARPVSVFPRLVKLSQNHMAKFENDTYWQKLIGEIMSGLDGQFPSTMPPDDQGRFIIGYYQQKNALWDKKSTETGKED